MRCTKCGTTEERLNGGHDHNLVIKKYAVNLGTIVIGGKEYDTNDWHTVECDDCNFIGPQQHVFADATCIKPKTCACGKVKLNSKPDPNAHDFSKILTQGETHHWYACTREGCDAKQGEDSHNYTDPEIVKDGEKYVTKSTCVCGASETKDIKYTVRWVDEDKELLQPKDEYEADKIPDGNAYTQLSGESNPIKVEDEDNTYEFKAWTRSTADNVITYTAAYTVTPKGSTNPGGTGDNGSTGDNIGGNPGGTDTPTGPVVDIDELDTPLVDEPDVPDEPVVDIDEPDTPLAGEPDEADEADEADTEIDEEDVPLAGAPKTGDDFQIWTWIALVMISGAGVAWLALADRKRRNTTK